MDADLAFEDFKEYQLRLEALPDDPDFIFGDNIVDLEIVSVGNLLKRHYNYGLEDERDSWVRQLLTIKRSGTNNQTKHKELSRLVKAVINGLEPRTKRKGAAAAQKSVPSNNTSIVGLTKAQKEAINEVLFQADLRLKDFIISVSNGVTMIKYKAEPNLYFAFESNIMDYDKVEYEHTDFNPMFSLGGRHTAKFSSALSTFNMWLLDVNRCKYEIETPDPWNLLLDETSTGNKFDDSGEKYTQKEQDLIKERLDVLEKVLGEQFDLHEAEIETLKQAVAAMKAQLAKLSKPIWKRVAKTIVIDTVKDIAKNQDTQHSMIETIRQTFENAKDLVAGFLN